MQSRGARISLTVLFAVGIPICLAACDSLRYDDPESGISLTMPPGWDKASPDVRPDYTQHLVHDDERIQGLLRSVETPALAKFVKRQEEPSDLAPTITIGRTVVGKELTNWTPLDTMRSSVVVPFTKMFPDIAFIDPAQATMVAGREAAYTRFAYTMTLDDGTELKVLARMWMIRKAQFMMMVGMTGPQPQSALIDDDFQEVLASIRFRE